MSQASYTSHQTREPAHASATPRPTLLFAIASDSPSAVRAVLDSGAVGANDDVDGGFFPQSALAFALTAANLRRRAEIVKVLLARGADPSSVANLGRRSYVGGGGREDEEQGEGGGRDVLEGVDPATR